MSEPSIRDIPRIKKMLAEANSMQALKTISPLILPLLRLVGVDVSQTQEALNSFEGLQQTVEEMATIPDRFNDLFAQRGWIMYDLMNFEVAKAAVARGESGDIDGAEAGLINYYHAENVEWLLRTMMGVEAFRPRMPLAEKAFLDYKEERYHACVPVVLALLDGLVNELHERQRGFFAEEVDLKAWDSIAAHEKGLNSLAKIFQRGRYKTTSEPISLPYRNGILHGMDLEYDNKPVAAKCWAALFATRDWAARVEQGLIQAPPQKPEKSWSDLFRQIKENEEDKRRLETWKSRHVVIGTDVPSTGDPTMFPEGMPERKVVEFLCYWKARNYGRMAEYLPDRSGSISKIAGKVREIYGATPLERFEIQQIKDEAPAITNIEVRLWYLENGSSVDRLVVFRLLSEDAAGRPAVPGKRGAIWRFAFWVTL